MEALIPVVTDRGLTAMLNATNTGVDAFISHIAFGDGNGQRYSPSAQQAALRRERARVPVGGGERIGSFEISVEALFDVGPSFTINEVGFVLDDGTMLAIWADPDVSLAFKTEGVPLVVSYNLALQGVPPDAITLNISGPSVNLTLVEPVALLSAEIIRAHRLGISAERQRATPIIQSTWR